MEEMKKDRKNGLFITTVMFEPNAGDMHYTPDKQEIASNLVALLDEMSFCVKQASRVLDHVAHESYVK